VYRAYDPQLRREVALKLMRQSAASPEEQDRLLREAHAMASLSHPNVVTAHDAGVISEGEVFIVMELVEGTTVTQWLKEKRRPWREVIAVFLEAGRGLAAAHAAGLVHRDFKPDNILIGKDGRVRVTDFGLARPLGSPLDGSSHAAQGGGAANRSSFAGTPLYMSPEQFLGKPADARSDVFSFCVALYVSLYGEHPFAGSRLNEQTIRSLARHVTSGALRPAPTTDVPGWLREIVVAGLTVDPGGRIPSMDDLLRRVGRGAKRARAARTAVGAAAFIGLLGAVAFARSVSGSRCGDGHLDAGEQCDDGNRSDTDACLSSCRWARCGDGHVRQGVEECDGTPGCSAGCLTCKEADASFVWDATGHCYSRHDRPATWSEARDVCLELGGDLAIYTSVYESRAVRTALFAPRGLRSPSWIGLYANHSGPPGSRESDPPPYSSNFVWVTSEALPKAYWAAGEPKPRSPGCVFETPAAKEPAPESPDAGGAWTVADCTLALPFVCERGGWSVRSSDNHAYRVFATPRSWEDARAACRQLGGHLAAITDAGEQDFVGIQAAFGFWIGGSDAAREGTFVWSTGEPFGYRHFGPGEPDDRFGRDDCLFFGADKVWHDRICEHQHPFMCEIMP
jgi:cysteine-rich repeat protein